MNVVKKAKNIIVKPKETWPEIELEQTTVKNLYISYAVAVILAAIPAISRFIGVSLSEMPVKEVRYGPFSMNFLWAVVSSYILSLAGIYIIAYITNALAPRFGSQKNMVNAMKAVVYSWTPYWIAEILYIVPHLSILVLLSSFYGIYLFYLGLPILMDTPGERALGYTIASVVASTLVFFLMGATAGALFAVARIFYP
ncbi:MAG: Yip1 family protein [Nitrospirota bacterium]